MEENSIYELVRRAAEAGASDVHLSAGVPARFRVDGELTDFGSRPLTPEDCEACARALSPDGSSLTGGGEQDFAVTFPGGIRCRVNLYRRMGAVSAALRILKGAIPQLSELGLPPAVEQFPEFRQGIVLVTGETGSGKSTTLASILDRINHTKRRHIITLEDPIEYIHRADLCVVDQREVGRDTPTYEQGLAAALREDPDVILIGEMRRLETVSTALAAAETGHLVFATLHTGSAPDAVDRVVQVFPEGQQAQVRLQLSMTLKAVLCQQLLPRRGGGRVPACEVMMVNSAVRNLIREAKTPQIANAVATGGAEGSVSMDNSILRLLREKAITPETARSAAHDPEYIRKYAQFA